MFTIQWLHSGRMHYLTAEASDTANMAFAALVNAGYKATLWQGAKQLRSYANGEC